jgi:elongator complex protein 5
LKHLSKPRPSQSKTSNRKSQAKSVRRNVQSPQQIRKDFKSNKPEGSLIIIDNLHPLLTNPSFSAPFFLASLTTPTTSLLLVCHTDIPLPFSPSSLSAPHPLSLLRYLATTLLQLHSLHHILAQKAAQERSHAEPVFGLQEETEGVMVGLGANDERGVVIEMEFRRRSGSGVREWFFLPSATLSSPPSTSSTSGPRKPTPSGREAIILLEDHPLYSRRIEVSTKHAGEDDAETTFNLGLTEKQRRDREGVILPYFDAQKDGGLGEGGRILYDMGVEDDFDEEEDEI